MTKLKIILSLLALTCGASAWAQYDSDPGVIGSLCRPGEYCPPPHHDPGYGNGPIDPSPYDPQPGYPSPGYPNQPHHPGHPGNPGHPGHPGHPGYPNQPGYPNHPGNPGYNDFVLPGYVNQTFYGPTNIDVSTLTGLYRYRGYRVSAVIIYGRSLEYSSRARLLADNRTVGNVNLTNYGGGQTIYPKFNMVVGQNFHNLFLGVSGRVQIDRIDVQLSRY